MTDYTMPVLSEQEREELIEKCKAAIVSLTPWRGVSEAKSRICFEIALAALTAKPVAMRYRWEPPHMKMPDGTPFTGDWKIVPDAEIANPGKDYRRVCLYETPPVPVKQEGEHRD